jgi:hypothetical protein
VVYVRLAWSNGLRHGVASTGLMNGSAGIAGHLTDALKPAGTDPRSLRLLDTGADAILR